MANESNKGILLESGTGELEVLHFMVKGEHYAINVVKVREILHIEGLTKVPNAHPAVAGLSLIRGEVMSVIDMHMVLEKVPYEHIEQSITLVCEFNKMMVAFAIDEVVGIARIKWSQIHKPDLVSADALVIGNITLNNTILMLLDYEKIMMEISPELGIRAEQIKEEQLTVDRSGYKILLADDSPLIRAVLMQSLTKAGIVDLKLFNDGQEIWDYMNVLYEEIGDKIFSQVDLVITDIEMPRLDGHTLTKNIKEHPALKRLPVIIFSSLITDDLYHKGEVVGADAQMSKPEVGLLVDLIDSFLFDHSA